VTILPITVKRKKGEKNDDVISKFRKASSEDNVSVVEEVRSRTAFVSKSQRNYAQRKLAAWRKQLRRQTKNTR